MSFENTYLKTALRNFESAAEMINTLVSEDVVNIPLNVFKSKLFPIIREWTVEKKSDNLLVWYNVTGGLNKRIRVTDQGDFAFYLPPPFTDVVLPKDRESLGNVNKIDALNKLITMKERDGETKEAIALSEQVNMLLSTTPDKVQQSKHVIMLAKAWVYLGEPVEEILSTAKVNLDEYDENGNYIGNKEVAIQNKGLNNDTEEEDELSF